jgi:uncharacterized membrane protein AbrB (regulator of aidB expression)
MDTAYVAVHQLVRFIGIAFATPVLLRLVVRQGRGETKSRT